MAFWGHAVDCSLGQPPVVHWRSGSLGARNFFTGEIELWVFEANKLCQTCDGAGIVEFVEPMDCAACDATGTILEGACPCCGGDGEQQITVKILCPDCTETEP